jgi:hypothetical protein
LLALACDPARVAESDLVAVIESGEVARDRDVTVTTSAIAMSTRHAILAMAFEALHSASIEDSLL